MITSAAASLLILLIHTGVSLRSMITVQHNKGIHEVFESAYLTDAVNYHQEVVDFAKRPVSTFLIQHFSRITHWSVGDSFVCINFFLLFLNGILLYVLSVRHFTTHRNALFNLLIYYSSFAILFSFFIPVYSYDEPVQYFFLFLTLIFYYENKLWLLIVSAFFALLARETSILLLAGLALYHYTTNGWSLKFLLKFAVPVLLYGLYLYWFFSTHESLIDQLQSDSRSRLNALHNNFADASYTIESIFALLNTSILPVFFISCKMRRVQLDDKTIRWFQVFTVVLVANALLTYVFTQAREVRLFNLPFVLFYPYGYFIRDEITAICKRIKITALISKWQFWLVSITGVTVSYLLSCKLFQTTLGVDSDHLFNEYSFAVLIIVLFSALVNAIR